MSLLLSGLKWLMKHLTPRFSMLPPKAFTCGTPVCTLFTWQPRAALAGRLHYIKTLAGWRYHALEFTINIVSALLGQW